MKLLKFVLLLALLAGTFAGGYMLRGASSPAAAPGRKVLYYVDPMHPAYKSDKPGVAPDCGMKLEPVYADDPHAFAVAPAKILYYRDPKQPNYRSDKPGLNPETGNTLEPVFDRTPPRGLPAGAIRIAPERQQLIGVTFAVAETSAGGRTIRTVGRVGADETRVGHVHTRVEGWVDKVMVDFTGDNVRKGEPMLTIYSPEMLATQQELLLAGRARDIMPTLFEAAKRRLQLWDLSDAQIEHVLQTGQPIRNVTVFAPMSGIVTERNVFPNQKVTPDSDLYTIVDLTRVWILADVFEADIASVAVGAPASVTVPSLGGTTIRAKVNYIQPKVDPATRTVQVRLDAPNPGVRLRPETYVSVEFGIASAPQLTVPASAVLDTGDRQTVFVDLGNGYLEPRAVVVGERIADRATILRGLSAGERVVSSGTFLVDSESQLKSAASSLGAPADQKRGGGK